MATLADQQTRHPLINRPSFQVQMRVPEQAVDALDLVLFADLTAEMAAEPTRPQLLTPQEAADGGDQRLQTVQMQVG